MLGLCFISWKCCPHDPGQLLESPSTAGLSPLQQVQEAGRKQVLTPGQFQPRVSASGPVLFPLPGCLPGADWGRPAPSITLPFLPVGPEGRFLSLSFVLSSRRPLYPGLAPGTHPTWSQTGRGGRGRTATFLSPESAAARPLFQKLLDLRSWKGAWSSYGLHPVSLQAGSLAALQSASHLRLHTSIDRELTISLRRLFYGGTAPVLGKSSPSAS